MAQMYFASIRIIELILFYHVFLLVIWLLAPLDCKNSDYDRLMGEAEFLG